MMDVLYRGKKGTMSMPNNELLVAQNDDPELLEWLANARDGGGGFLSKFAHACLVADWDNYGILRPVAIQMRRKYPLYEPSEAVKREIKRRPK